MNSGLILMRSVLAFLMILPLAWPQGMNEPPRPDRFRYERSILPGAEGPNRLHIDVPLISGSSSFQVSVVSLPAPENAMHYVASGGLNDLRIYDTTGREVPFLLVHPSLPESKWLTGRFLPVAATKKTSGFEVDLGRVVSIDGLQLTGLPAPFLKRVQLEGGGDREHWVLLAAEGTLFDLPDEKLKQLELQFSPGEYRFLRVTWDDSSSGRLALPAFASARLSPAQAPAPSLRVQLSFERREGEPGTSRFRLRLPAARLPVVAIELDVRSGHLLRQARVTEAQLTGDEVVPVVLGSATLRRAERGDLAASDLRIPIRSPVEAQLDFITEDGDNPPLEPAAVWAVFAHLPWIYFESRDTGILHACYGSPDLPQPRYDLEAMRDSISQLTPADARWGEAREKKSEPGMPPPSPLPVSGGILDSRQFRYSREIPAGPSGLNALLLDAAVLAHSNLADLRIASADGRQIPYLIEKADEPLSVELQPLEKAQGPQSILGVQNSHTGVRSFYRLRLPHENLPPARLVLTTAARIFRRSVLVVIEKNPDSWRQQPWTTRVAEGAWNHAEPGTAAPALVLKLPRLMTQDALLIVDEGDNQPLALERPRLLLPSYRLRFFRDPSARLSLLYGQKDLAAPRYDLALLAPRLTGTASHEITPGPEVQAAEKPETISPTKLFWSALGLAVVILFALIVLLVRKNAGSSQSP